MSEQEFLALEPRERERLVQRVLFEQEWQKPRHGTCCTCQQCGHHYDDCICGDWETIEGAWQVVEKMREEHEGSFKIQWIPACLAFEAEEGFWEAGPYRFDAEMRPELIYPIRASTAPLAICIAALKAKGAIE